MEALEALPGVGHKTARWGAAAAAAAVLPAGWLPLPVGCCRHRHSPDPTEPPPPPHHTVRSVVMCQAFGQDAFPVDTHIHR